MIEVSDAQVAPISPSSRFSPTSAGAAVVAAASVLLLIPDPFSDRAPQGGCHPRVGSRELQVSVAYALSENIVETRPISEKWPIGVVSVTCITGLCPLLTLRVPPVQASSADVRWYRKYPPVITDP